MFEEKGQRLGSNSTFNCPSVAIQDTWSAGPTVVVSGITPTKTVFSAMDCPALAWSPVRDDSTGAPKARKILKRNT
jgi:hypothetical protein